MSHWLKRSLLMTPLLGLAWMPSAMAVTNVDIAPAPLAGVTQAFPANVFLALSVEFPTAGAAYNTQKDGQNILDADADLKTEYLGYFDPKKCYILVNNAYFEPVSLSTTDSSGRLGMCNNSGATNQYSGNILNWATMTALDIYRSSMTGGNRAFGTTNDTNAYSRGDASNFTTLRRAKVVPGQNQSYRLENRLVRYRKDVLLKLFPHNLVSAAAANDTVLTMRFDNTVFSTKLTYPTTISSYQKKNGECNRWNNQGACTRYNQIDDLTKPNFSTANFTATVVTQVCKSGLLEANCTQYGSNYKPEGLMQRNVEKMNFSSLGYLNITGGSTGRSGGHQISGGVVRSELGSIRSEFSETTGQYMVDPFPQVGVSNSGSINYLNKFGDANGYKTNDPVAELYYTALRYIRGMGYVDNVNWMPNDLTNAEKDDFPVVNIKNKDPFKLPNGQWDTQKVCSKNTIMLIGDTNSHADGNLPNLDSNNGFMPTDDTIDTQEYINKIKKAELAYIGAPANSTFMNGWLDRGGNTGSSRSPGGLPALAYWANMENIRPDVSRKVTAQTFAIDVLENTDYKFRSDSSLHWVRNAYFLAGKYGGFEDKNGDGIPNRSDPSEWTNDPIINGQVQTSITEFRHGKPKGFALANNPSSMVSALEQAFSQVSSAEGASQAGVATSGSADLVDVDNDLIIRSTYKDSNWSGDVVGFKLTASQDPNSVYGQLFQWSASQKLTDLGHANRNIITYHRGTIVPFVNEQANFLDTLLGVSNPTGLIGYIRGDSSGETLTGGFRSRLSQGQHDKMGTVVNSEVISIRRPKNHPAGCSYADANVLNRSTMYGMASNDGMYHILDVNGVEKLAYLPEETLPKLSNYATPGYDHRYINDGLSAAAEVCLAAGAGGAHSVVVGTTGRGGRTVYALDVTNIANAGADNFLWEFTSNDDADLGHVIGKPVIAKDNTGSPIVIFTSGYNSDTDEGYVYILRMNKNGAWVEGQNYQKIRLDGAGVGGAFGYDSDNNGMVDTIYAGDLDGKLWKVVSNASGTWSGAFGSDPLFEAPAGTKITATPFAQVTRGRLTVFVGTGSYLGDTDMNTNDQNYVFGIFDEGNTVANNQLLQQNLAAENNAALAGKLWMLSTNAIESQHKGWRIHLRPGQVVADQAHVQNKRAVFFNVFTPMPASNCLVQSQTYLLGADVRSGGNYDEPLFDTNNDGVINSADTIGGFYKLGEMLGPVGTMLQTDDGRLFYVVIGSDGKLNTLEINTLPIPPGSLRYKRLSWREIF